MRLDGDNSTCERLSPTEGVVPGYMSVLEALVVLRLSEGTSRVQSQWGVCRW